MNSMDVWLGYIGPPPPLDPAHRQTKDPFR